MEEFLKRLEQATDLREVRVLIDGILDTARAGKTTRDQKRLFLRYLLFNQVLLDRLEISAAVDYLCAVIKPTEWTELFADAVEKEFPRLVVDLIDMRADLDHRELLRLLPPESPKVLYQALKHLNAYLEKCDDSARCLRGLRVMRLMADIYRTLAADPKAWRRRSPPFCCIDSDRIAKFKEEKAVNELAAAYETRVNQLQRIDLRRCLTALSDGRIDAPQMATADYDRVFGIEAPLRLGISSANASDNHLRSKEQGGKTLNIAIDLQREGEKGAAPPLSVTARRLDEPKLILRSLSMDFKADFEASERGDAKTMSELFFAYRRSGDEAMRLVKQSLVHTGIIGSNSQDIITDIAAFTGGGGLELTTSSKVLQGSGLGTSSILSAAILKMLYRLCGHPFATAGYEYPGLYDHSLLLEQSLGLNSGWQDARGASGGPSAIKDFYAPPTDGLPAPERTFLTDVDEGQFTARIILFDTGMARAATRGLNVVLDAYLSRDRERYAAICESLTIHDEIVAALCAGNYDELGKLFRRYWQLRCILDPEATNDVLQYLFEDPQISNLTEGGLITGAGGGGFALLVAKEGQADALCEGLNKLRKDAAFAKSSVASYRLNSQGILLSE